MTIREREEIEVEGKEVEAEEIKGEEEIEEVLNLVCHAILTL